MKKNNTNSDNMVRSYGYTYDNLNRLTNAQYIRPTLSGGGDVEHSYDESMSYDKNGNIQALQRNGGLEVQAPPYPVIDDLRYNYSTDNPNQLISVEESTNGNAAEGFIDGANNANEYGYDANGNMNRDDNKKITAIVYNHLNLPTQITFFGTNKKINYLYNATGQKLRKTVNDGVALSITDYMGGYQYNNGILQFFPTAEGYVKNTVVGGVNSYDYVFNYTDHLGNIRLSYGIDPNTQALTKFEENNYYPFGLKHKNYNYLLKEIQEKKETIITQEAVAATATAEAIPEVKEDVFEKKALLKEEEYFDKVAAIKNQEQESNVALVANSGYLYKYENREFQDELGLNVYPFKYRTYDPALGRFWSIDPVAEKYVYNGVYNFAENRVIESIDLEGKESWYTQDGHLATKAGPYTSQARQQLNLYSPSEVQQAKAKAANYKGAMLSQDRMSSSDRKARDIEVKAAIAEKEAISQSLDNHENLGSPHTSKFVMQGVAYGAVDVATGEVLGKVFQGGKILLGLGKATEMATEVGSFSKILSSTGEFDPVKTLYRGTTGSEASSSSIYLTDNAGVAASYVKNGGQVMQYDVSSSGLYTLEHSGQMTVGPGIHTGSNTISTEYQFIGKELVKELNNIGTPYKP